MKIIVLGNSVGLRVRPPNPSDPEQNQVFSSLLESDLKNKGIPVMVKNMCHGRYLIEQILDQRDVYIREFPDVYVVVAGITDVCNREIPLWFSNLLHGRRSSKIRRALMAFYIYMVKPSRKFWVYIRGKKPWRSFGVTKYGFKTLADELIKNTNAKVIFVEVMQVDDRIENELPGSSKNVERINRFMHRLKEQDDTGRLQILELGMVSKYLERPDGIHLSSNGHKVLASEILGSLEYQ